MLNLAMFNFMELFKIYNCSFSKSFTEAGSLTKGCLEKPRKCCLFCCDVISLLPANEMSNAVPIDNWSIFPALPRVDHMNLTVTLDQWKLILQFTRLTAGTATFWKRTYRVLFSFLPHWISRNIFELNFKLCVLRFLGYLFKMTARKFDHLI